MVELTTEEIPEDTEEVTIPIQVLIESYKESVVDLLSTITKLQNEKIELQNENKDLKNKLTNITTNIKNVSDRLTHITYISNLDKTT